MKKRLKRLKRLSRIGLMIVFSAIVFVILFFSIQIVIAEFIPTNLSSWKEDFSKFKAALKSNSLGQMNGVWENAKADEKKDFLEKYAEHKKKDLKITGLESKDLKWNRFGELTNGKASIDFNSLRDSLVKIDYNENAKKITYTFKGNDGKELEFSFDGGKHTKDGYHEIKGRLDKVNVNYNTGKVSYENGKYTLENGAALRVEGAKGAANIEQNDINKPAVVSIKSGSIEHQNAKIGVIKGIIESTGIFSSKLGGYEDKYSAEFLSADKPITLFMDNRDHSDFSGAYQSIDFSTRSIVMDSKDAYSVARVLSDFNSIKARGDYAYVINGESTLLFKDGKVYLVDPGKQRGFYNVPDIQNLDNTDLNNPGNIYEWSKYKDSTYADLFDKKTRVVQTIATSTNGWSGTIIQKLSTNNVGIEYNKEFEAGYFKGTEEQRVAAILNDLNTKVSFNFGSPVPGQVLASQMAGNIDLGLLVGKLNIGNLFGGSSGGMSGSLSSGLTLLQSYNPDASYTEASKYPVNQFLTTLASDYAGDYTDLRNNQMGVTSLEYTSNGIYINGNKVEGVSSQISSAMRNMVGQGLFQYQQGVGIVNPDYAKYQQQIQQNFPLTQYYFVNDENDFHEEDSIGKSYVFGPDIRIGLLGRERAVLGTRISAAKEGLATINSLQSKYAAIYDYYRNKGLLP